MARTRDLSARKGETLVLEMDYAVEGVLLDLSAYTGQMQSRPTLGSDQVIYNGSTSNGRIVLSATSPNIQITIDPDDLDGVDFSSSSDDKWPVKVGVYDFKIVSPAGVVKYLLEGKFKVFGSVSR